MKPVFYTIFTFFGLASGLVFPQQFNFHNYSVKEGVAQSQVYSLLQDSRGYLWMGTRGGGITRFDGVDFKTFTVKNGLVNNYVFCIKEDVHGNLWIGTNNGLSSYNGISFKTYPPAGDSTQVWIQEIDFDKRGRKWLATNVGVLFLDEKGIFTNVSELLHDKKSVINAIHVDTDGNVWYGSAEGLFKITENGGVFKKEHFDKTRGFGNNSITAIKQDVDGSLWIGTYGDGAYVYNGIKFFRIDYNLELYKQTILDIYFDNKDNVWLATLNHGVSQYNKVSKSFAWITESEGLSNNHVRSILQDKSGNYWFGTSGGGVCNYFGKQFTVYDKSSGLTGSFIYSVFRDSRGRLWVGTSDKGITLLDSSGFVPYNSSNGFADVKVKTINEDNSGNVYLGTDGQGVFVFNNQSFQSIEKLQKKYIRDIVKDKDGAIWIATAGNGIYKIDPAKNTFGEGITNITDKDGLLHNRVTCLHYDKQGRLWYGTESNGLGYVLNGKPRKMILTVKEGLPSNTIRSICEDDSGYLWGGTAGDGIFSVPLYQGDFKVRAYSHNSGLTSANVYLLTTDAENNLFVGTETGLDYITLGGDRKPLEIKHFSKGEGFTGIETCQNSVFRENDGTIWFGTINGLTKYDPSVRVKNFNEPITTITNVELFFEPLANTSYKNLVGGWNVIKSLRLPYNQNHLTFDFIAINFSNPDAVKYQWKLDGFDKDWSPVSTQHRFTYPNLSPGKYSFMLKACNEDGVWNKTPVTFNFVIVAPFWWEWWFIALVIITVILIVFIVFRWRVNVVRKKSEEEQKKIQMEKEIVELEQKALRLQMNPHFIFNALNSIQSQIGTDNEQKARYYLAKFSRLMRQILDNSRNVSITLEEEVNTLENYLLIEKFCNGERFDYSISVDENIERDYVKIPPMILQPFIENAIKHGLKHSNDKRGLIEVSFKESNGVLECTVTDNGIGRKKSEELNRVSKETYHKSTAMIVTRERLEILNEGKGPESLEIVDLYDEAGEACGTRVIVRIPVE